jgi:hypothetical protein
MVQQRVGQVWLYHGGTPLPALMHPHGFKERTEPLDNLEQDEVNRSPREESAEGGEIPL